uniref:Ribosomal protein S4 n=1 Tax=Isoetes engelmannii TaxID=37427 RepID=G0Y651_ISOEN|nr:ribosomal protein S4 [Isoetes engelmannii]
MVYDCTRLDVKKTDYHLPRFKTCRRIEENVWVWQKLTEKQKHIISELRRKREKQSYFSVQLRTIQRLSLFYGKSLPRKAKKHTYLNKRKSLLYYLEKRLDVILVCTHFCSTICGARQLISHKKICVNFETVNTHGFRVSNGDLISIVEENFFLFDIREKMKTNPICEISTYKPPYGRSNSKEKIEISNRRLSLQGKGGETTLEDRLMKLKILHLEVNYRTLKAVVLYEPYEILFPYKGFPEEEDLDQGKKAIAI